MVEEDRPSGSQERGKVYRSWCKRVNEWMGKSSEKVEEEQKEKKEELDRLDSELTSLQRELNNKKMKYGVGSRKFEKEKKKIDKKIKKVNKKKAKIKQEEFYSAVEFLGWDLEVHEVLTFAGFTSLLGLIGVGIGLLMLTLLGFNLMDNLIFLPGLVVAPLALYMITANYPEILANRIKVKSIGRSPECINYLIMSMSLNPALDQAVKFTAQHTDEPLSTGFRKMIWDLMLRRYTSIEEAIVDFANKWGEWNEDLRQSLYVIRSATLEKSEGKMKEDLNKAYDIILTGTKSTMEDFASSLSGPTMVLFALGVILPLVIGALLPMLSIQLPSATQMAETGGATQNTGATAATQSSNAPLIILLMDIVFPSGAAVYSYYILGKRPGTSKPPKVKSKLSDIQKNGLLAGGIIGGVLISLLAFPPFSKYFIFTNASSLPILIGITFAISFYLITTTYRQKKKKDEILELEDQFPNALFQLGNRIAEGKPIERALEDIKKDVEGSKMTELIDDIRYRLKVTRKPLSEVLFNEETGVLRRYPSRTIHATLRTVVKATKKDNVTAGRTITQVSTYQRDLKKIEHDIRASLESAVSMMKSTALFFAPLVMGITTGLYNLLYDQFQSMPYSVSMISPSKFSVIIGVYLLLMSMVIIYFSVGVLEGEDKIEMKYSMGTGLPVAIGIYTLTSILSQSMVGA